MRLLISWLSRASAQDFPEDDAFFPLPCASDPMTDPYRDAPGAVMERDLVGEREDAAGFRAADFDFVYFRMRLDQDPIPDPLRPFAWAVLLDTDGDLSSYEAMIKLDGTSSSLELYENTVITEEDLPTDPPDLPPVASWSVQDRARSVAAGSRWGADEDFFLDLAIPWEDLEDIDIEPNTPARVWLATSSSADALGGDLACHDGALGPSSLSGASGDETALDPRLDSDGDGFSDRVEYEQGTDPYDPSSTPEDLSPDAPLLEGGGGCETTPSGPRWWLVSLAVLWMRRTSCADTEVAERA